MTPHDILLPFLWTANGLLVVVFLLAENALPLLLLPLLGWLLASAPAEHRPWTAAAAALSLLSAVLSPQPIPALALLMAGTGIAAVRIERFNPAVLRWRITGGLALYALMGMGFTAFQRLSPALGGSDPMLLQGQHYLGVLASIAMYFYPLGYLALLAQAIWVHPPLAQTPQSLIHGMRARGKQ